MVRINDYSLYLSVVSQIKSKIDAQEFDECNLLLDKAMETYTNQEQLLELKLLQAEMWRIQGKFKTAIAELLNIDIDTMEKQKLKIKYFLELLMLFYREGRKDRIDLYIRRIETLGIYSAEFKDLLPQFYDLRGKFSINDEEFNLAHQFYTKGIEACGDVPCKWKASMTNGIGLVHFHKGELEQALKYYLHARDLNIEMGNELMEGINDNNIGYTYYLLKENKLSRQFLDEAYQIFLKLENGYFIATAIFNLIRISLLEGDRNATEAYLNQSSELWEKPEYSENERVITVYRMCQALNYYHSRNPAEKLKSAELFKDIINDEMEAQFVIISMVYLLEILIIEYQMFHYDELFAEIKYFSRKLEEAADQHASHLLLTYVYIYNAKLAILDGDFVSASENYETGLKIATEQQLNIASSTILNGLEGIKEQLIKLKEIVNSSTPITEKMAHDDLLDYLRAVKDVI